jgi:hypothetical protein
LGRLFWCMDQQMDGTGAWVYEVGPGASIHWGEPNDLSGAWVFSLQKWD